MEMGLFKSFQTQSDGYFFPRLTHAANLIIAALMMSVSGVSFACNIFVSTSGNDANSGLTSNDPKLTIQAAADIATNPGDTVCVRPGVYFENNQSTPSTTIKAIKPQASGTPGSPIVFQADPNYTGAVIIDQQFDLSTGVGSAFTPIDVVGFYIRAHDYITIRGFEIRNVSTGIRTEAIDAPMVSNAGTFDPPSFIIMENNHIHSVRRDREQPSFDSNIAAIRPNHCYDCIIRGNRLHDVALIDLSDNDEYDNANSAGIHSFGMLRTVIENNEIYDAHTGIFQKGWSKQPLPGNPDYDFVTPLVPPAIDTNTDFGLLVRRNLIHDTVWGIHLSPSGGSGRLISNSGNANGNPPHHNIEIYENIFYSTTTGIQRLGSSYARMEWALRTDLRGTVAQSKGIKFFNNTAITHNGVAIDAISDIQIYNNLLSLSAVTSGSISGPHIAIQTEYARIRAEQLLDSGTRLNLGTPASPIMVTPIQGVGTSAAAGTNRAAGVCIDNNTTPDPNLSDNGGNFPASTTPNLPSSPAGDSSFYCNDNVQWSAEIALADFNYYHIEPDPTDPNAPEDNGTFRLQRYGAAGNGVQTGGIEQLVNFSTWQTFQLFDENTGSGDFGMAVSNPDANSAAVDLASQSDLLEGVTIVPSAGVVIDPTRSAPFQHSTLLNDAGDADGSAGGTTAHIGAFPAGVYNASNGPFSPASDSGFIGPARLIEAPSAVSVSP